MVVDSNEAPKSEMWWELSPLISIVRNVVLGLFHSAFTWQWFLCLL